MTRIGGGGRLLGREWERRLGHGRREAYGDIERARLLSGPPVLLLSVPEPIDWRAGTAGMNVVGCRLPVACPAGRRSVGLSGRRLSLPVRLRAY
jgi:hypothetical protein